MLSFVLLNLWFYYMSFVRSQVLLWKFLYQNRFNIYGNMHRKQILLPALWLAGFNSIILSPHYSVLRSPHFDHLTSMCKQYYFHPFIHICWSANVKLVKVHNCWRLRSNFNEVSIIQNTWQYMASLEIWYPLKLILGFYLNISKFKFILNKYTLSSWPIIINNK